MRKLISLKTLLRSPAKTLLTFLLIAAASFALFSRVVDYAVTTREAAKAESFYNGVAALDNTQPLVVVDEVIDGVNWGIAQVPDNKPWPSDEQIEEFSSLPGVTLADMRYMTAGKIEDYKRIADKEDYTNIGTYVLEGTYDGYEEDPSDSNYIILAFQDVTVYAGEVETDADKPLNIYSFKTEQLVGDTNPYTPDFFDGLEKGSRCLLMGSTEGRRLNLKTLHEPQEKALRMIDGLGEDYLETEDFALYKEKIDVFHESQFVYDIVYTKDTRAIPRFNERTMVISEGSPLTAGDADACVVSEDFLETYGLSVGDRIHVELGDILRAHNAKGAIPRTVEQIPDYADTAELEIIGAYRFLDTYSERLLDYNWSYTVDAVFVPSSLLPVEVPDDYEPSAADFSVLIEDANDIEEFQEMAEPLAGEMGVGLRFSDGGWTSMKDSFKTGSIASVLTAVLYVAGAALALLLAVYLYIGRNKKSYAIMRTLGVSGKKAGSSIALPFVVLSVFAMPVGGLTGLFYARHTVADTLAGMADTNAPEGYVYVLDATLPVRIIILCMVCELAFATITVLFFLWKMQRISPLELLQEGNLRAGAGTKAEPDIADTALVPAPDIAKISEINEAIPQGKYSTVRQVWTYILRHMRRGIGKTAVSLVLAIVMAAGIGTLGLARLAYQDAYYEVEVKCRVLSFASLSMKNLSKSNLVKDFYCYNSFTVRTNDIESQTPMVVTNDIERYLAGDPTITYADGYDISAFEKTGEVCLVGQMLAETMEIRPGDEIRLISNNWYDVVSEIYEELGEDLRTAALERETTTFKVIGIVETNDESAGISIFTGMDNNPERVYGQTFPYVYGEFTLADNERLDELNLLLESEQKEYRQNYAPSAFYHIDSESFENVKRIRDLLVSLFPIAVIAAILIGIFGPGLVVIQLAQEAAFLRVLGVTKKRARCMLVFQQIILCIIGIVLVAGVLFLYSPQMFTRCAETFISCWAIYFVGCVFGTFVAAVQVTRRKVLELLQVKE